MIPHCGNAEITLWEMGLLRVRPGTVDGGQTFEVDDHRRLNRSHSGVSGGGAYLPFVAASRR